MTPWKEVLFPYEAALAGRQDLRELAAAPREGAPGDEIVETYTCARDGSVRVAIENRSHGYRNDFVLGMLG